MIRLSGRALTAVGAGAFAVALVVGSGVPAHSAPASRSIDSMQDLKGAWLTSLTGFQKGDPISWQHRLTVRKVKGSAAVASEEWRNCANHKVECAAGKVTGGGWSAPSQVLLAMDPRGVVHGVGATGSMMVTTGEDGMSAVMLSAGQQDDWTATPDPTSMNSQGVLAGALSAPFAATGPTVSCPAHG